MKVLIIGGGGREHAIAWRCAQSPRVSEVLVAPGNAGTAAEHRVRNVPVGAGDIESLVKLAKAEAVDLTIVGPEQPLVDGIVDRFSESGLRCFGPDKAASQLEGSKAYTKAFLKKHNIPTAAYETFSDVAEAKAYLRGHKLPLVIKADGLAAGKGVVIATTTEEGIEAIESMLTEKRFGDAGTEIVIEEFLEGEEASFIVITDGINTLPMATSQDHKARDNGDRGPNTGGMGAYSPAPVVDDDVAKHVMKDIIQPTLDGLAAEGIRYRGFLYAGLMIDAQGKAKVLEFNCRLGDPETQPLMARLRSDLPALCDAVIDGTLDRVNADWDTRVALGIVLAADGYPGDYTKGVALPDLEALDAEGDVKTFHAGTAMVDGELRSSGGRVICITALGETACEAAERAYKATASANFDGLFYRDDIGYRAIERERRARS
ncbi:MAG: phosphoribosylamine--glycine ligase [Pseudomonadota bacterium]